MSNFPLIELWKQSVRAAPQSTILAFDPGETTGVALLHRTQTTIHVRSWQIQTSDLISAHEIVKPIIAEKDNDIVVCEDYKVYGWKTQQHSWSSLHTPKLIGTISSLCADSNIPLRMQMAQQVKYFCTDEKLRYWGVYNSGNRHANDAVRHAVYYFLFGGSNGNTTKH